jgi:hypothetical protein
MEHGRSWDCKTLRTPHFLDNRLTDGGEAVRLTSRPHLTPQDNPLCSFVRGWVTPNVIARLEGLGKLKEIILPHPNSNPRPSNTGIFLLTLLNYYWEIGLVFFLTLRLLPVHELNNFSFCVMVLGVIHEKGVISFSSVFAIHWASYLTVIRKCFNWGVLYWLLTCSFCSRTNGVELDFQSLILLCDSKWLTV